MEAPSQPGWIIAAGALPALGEATAGQLGPACTLELEPDYRADLRAQDSAIVAAAEQNLARYGLKLDGASCSIYPAAIGAEPYRCQLCRLTVQRPNASGTTAQAST